MVSWSIPEPSGPAAGAQVCPSLSVKEILQEGEVALSSAAKARPVTKSVKPIGSESITTCVGPGRFAQVARAPAPLLGPLKLTKSVSRSDRMSVTPFTDLRSSSNSRRWASSLSIPGCHHSTVGPVVSATGVITPQTFETLVTNRVQHHQPPHWRRRGRKRNRRVLLL